MKRKRRKSDVKGKATEVEVEKKDTIRIEHLNYKVGFKLTLLHRCQFLVASHSRDEDTWSSDVDTTSRYRGLSA